VAAITPSRFARIFSKSSVRREDSCDCTTGSSHTQQLYAIIETVVVFEFFVVPVGRAAPRAPCCHQFTIG